MATQRYRRNAISSIRMEDGLVTTDHNQMAGIIWDSYKQRMGMSNGIHMGFNLDSLLQRVEGLETLSRPFEKEEIDDIIKHMPADKAPGPDGFNGLFLKKCWPIICSDFYKLVAEFHQGGMSLESINTSFITLLPKVGVPEGVNDFRPISLTNAASNSLPSWWLIDCNNIY